METTNTGTFDHLQRYLAELEIPEVFANLWNQFQNAVPDVRPEAVVRFYLERSWPSHAHIHGWGTRHVGYRRRGVEHHGFIESLANLRQVEAVDGVVSIETDSYLGVFLPDVAGKRLVGFLYFACPRRQ